jgi:hypothetical protein
MKRGLMLLVVGLLLIAVPALSQTDESTTRVERQHHLTRFQKNHMDQTEKSLREAIESESVGLQKTGIQAVRDLEQLDTRYPFADLIGPLSDKLKDSKADGTVRMLAALALDELHSDAGDAAIQSVADDKTANQGLRNLCKALLVRSWLESE